MLLQNLGEDVNVMYKCDVLTHRKFKEDMTLKMNPVGVRFSAPLQTDPGSTRSLT